MGTMSYCKFRNTYGDLLDCVERWDDIPDDKMDEGELKARKRLIAVCCTVALDFGYEIGREFEEL